jgi:hypothetical protein
MPYATSTRSDQAIRVQAIGIRRTPLPHVIVLDRMLESLLRLGPQGSFAHEPPMDAETFAMDQACPYTPRPEPQYDPSISAER